MPRKVCETEKVVGAKLGATAYRVVRKVGQSQRGFRQPETLEALFPFKDVLAVFVSGSVIRRLLQGSSAQIPRMARRAEGYARIGQHGVILQGALPVVSQGHSKVKRTDCPKDCGERNGRRPLVRTKSKSD